MRSKIECKNCQTDLSNRHSNTKYCNNDCYRAWSRKIRKHPEIEKICTLCDKTYVKSGKGMRDSVYCSESCRYTSGIIRKYGDKRTIYKLWISAESCQNCGTGFKSTQDKHVDHCHKTNKVRGILCNGCNIGLGSFKDDINLLKNAIKYLETSNAD
jgi:Recombination endonuclease VII